MYAQPDFLGHWRAPFVIDFDYECILSRKLSQNHHTLSHKCHTRLLRIRDLQLLQYFISLFAPGGILEHFYASPCMQAPAAVTAELIRPTKWFQSRIPMIRLPVPLPGKLQLPEEAVLPERRGYSFN